MPLAYNRPILYIETDANHKFCYQDGQWYATDPFDITGMTVIPVDPPNLDDYHIHPKPIPTKIDCCCCVCFQKSDGSRILWNCLLNGSEDTADLEHQIASDICEH